jgi:amidase
MSFSDDYWKYDGLGLAELVRKKEVTALELVEVALESAARLNPTLNALCHDLSDRARTAARRPLSEGPFVGVPFLLKDIGAQMQGTPCECGSRLMQGHVSKIDTHLTERFHRAGLITIGKTTTPEFGAQVTTEPVLTGVTRNPWNTAVTPGGSSGGSAAAVAAGIVPIAHANDGLGSIRIPAANCGLFGLKPTRQRTPTGPVAGEVSGGRGVEFVVSRSVRDSAALLDAVHGADAGAPYGAPALRRPYVDELTGKSEPLKIALMDHTFTGARVHPECAQAARSLASLCIDLGHTVEAAAPDLSWDAYMWAIRMAGSASFAAGLAAAGRAVGRIPSPDNLEPLTWRSFLEGQQLLAADYFRGLETFTALQRGLGRFFEEYDILITPMLSLPPADLGWLGTPDDDLDVFWEKFAGDTYSPFAGVFNVTGQPAASIPCHETGDRRPIGTQIVARFGEEGTIFRLAAQIEQARPWRERRPAVHVSARAPTSGRAAPHRSQP